jgi:hypothetical protein
MRVLMSNGIVETLRNIFDHQRHGRSLSGRGLLPAMGVEKT